LHTARTVEEHLLWLIVTRSPRKELCGIAKS
jgi:hypothetical protein